MEWMIRQWRECNHSRQLIDTKYRGGLHANWIQSSRQPPGCPISDGLQEFADMRSTNVSLFRNMSSRTILNGSSPSTCTDNIKDPNFPRCVLENTHCGNNSMSKKHPLFNFLLCMNTSDICKFAVRNQTLDCKPLSNHLPFSLDI